MKFFKNKKGDISGQKMIVYSIHAFIFAAVFIGFVFVVGFHSSSKTQIPSGIEDVILEKRFTDTCFGEEVGIIDLNRFTNQSLEKCYLGEGKQYRLTLFVDDISIEPITIETLYWKGSGDSFSTKKVLVLKDERIIKGEIKIEVQNK
jgi:hypothetical protein